MTEIEFTNIEHTQTVDDNLTEVICIVDRSGSMERIKNDAIGGFNAFLNAHKDSHNRTIMTVVQFDDEYEIKYNGVSPETVLEYTERTFIPRGMTALLDAIGKTIRDVDQRRNSETTIPGKTIVSILTDGEENSSKEYKLEQIKRIIDSKKSLGWEVLFVAAGLDKFKTEQIGVSFGLSSNRVLHVGASPEGIQNAYNSIKSATISYCSTGSIVDDWNESTPTKKRSTTKKRFPAKTRYHRK